MKNHSGIPITKALLEDPEGYALKVMEIARTNILDIAVPRPNIDAKVIFKGCDIVIFGKTPDYPGVGHRYSIFSNFENNQFVGDELVFQNFAEVSARQWERPRSSRCALAKS